MIDTKTIQIFLERKKQPLVVFTRSIGKLLLNQS